VDVILKPPPESGHFHLWLPHGPVEAAFEIFKWTRPSKPQTVKKKQEQRIHCLYSIRTCLA
jgi:hypothetical protein